MTPRITYYKLLNKHEHVMETCENQLKADPRNKKLLCTYGLAAANAGFRVLRVVFH